MDSVNEKYMHILQSVLEDRFNPRTYSLGSYGEDALCIEEKDDRTPASLSAGCPV